MHTSADQAPIPGVRARVGSGSPSPASIYLSRLLTDRAMLHLKSLGYP